MIKHAPFFFITFSFICGPPVVESSLAVFSASPNVVLTFRKAKNKPETGVLRIRKGGSPHLRKEQTRDRKLRYPLTMFSPPNNFNPLVVKQEKYWRIPAICRRPASIPGSNFQRKRFRLALKNTAESSIRTRRAAMANRRNKNKKWGNLLSRPQKKNPLSTAVSKTSRTKRFAVIIDRMTSE